MSPELYDFLDITDTLSLGHWPSEKPSEYGIRSIDGGGGYRAPCEGIPARVIEDRDIESRGVEEVAMGCAVLSPDH